MALLEIKGLRQRFGGVTALDGADLSVEQGRITGLIGPNGAGKTTLFNAVTGALRPNDGAVTFDGTDVTGWRPDRLAGVGLSRTFQIARGLAQLTVIENLMLYGKHQPGETFCAAVLRTSAARAREEELRLRAIEVARELNLLHVGDNRAIDLSGGQKKLLELGRALMAEPKLIMLDEPAAGINPTLGEEARRAHPRAQGARHHLPDHRAQHGTGRGAVRPRRGAGAGQALHRRPLRRSARRSARAGSLYGAPGMTMLSVTNVVAGYGAHDEVLKGVGITVAEREMVVLIGPNGAGKSTCSNRSPDSCNRARARSASRASRSAASSPREITRQGIAFVPQEANVFPSLSVEANLEMGGYVDRRATEAAHAGRLCALSAARRAPRPGGAHALRRPAPGARGRDGADGGAAADAARRALRRPLARGGGRIVRADQGPARRGHDRRYGGAERARRTADCGSRLPAGRRLECARGRRARALAADAEVRHAFLGG